MNNSTTKGLLYPAMHKFYSALYSLEQFEKGKNFFDNVSHLDNFFSEYRNITFVLQKSLAQTEFMGIYKKNRDRFLKNETSTWFISKRNEVLKEHPFELEKKVMVTSYLPESSSALPEKMFTIENDIEYSTLIESLRSYFIKINLVEVYFSVEFSFYEKGKDRELYEDFIVGINNMKLFLRSMESAIKEECELCNRLQGKIDDINFYRFPKSMLFIDDYVYYCQNDEFEKASGMQLNPGFSTEDSNQDIVRPNESLRTPLSHFFEVFGQSNTTKIKDAFKGFIIQHLTIFNLQKNMMPTFMIIYEDDTFELKTFHTSIKTTVYRKINEIARRLEQYKIKSVYFVTEMLHYSIEKNDYKEIFMINSKDRIKHKTSESLSFFMTDNDLQFDSYSFDVEKIKDVAYIGSILNNMKEGKMHSTFFHPIKKEFKRIKNSK